MGKSPAHNSTLRIPEDVLSRNVADETVLLNLATEQYYGLEGVGTRFWALIEAGTTFGQAVDALAAEYEVGRATLMTDLTELTVDLERNGLLLIDAT